MFIYLPLRISLVLALLCIASAPVAAQMHPISDFLEFNYSDCDENQVCPGGVIHVYSDGIYVAREDVYERTSSGNLRLVKISREKRVEPEEVSELASIFECRNEYRFVVEDDLDIVVGDDVVSKIKLPGEGEFKNFAFDSVKKTKTGFRIKVDWGSGIDHYEVQFNFRCKQNNFYLYRVKKVSYSTTNYDSGNFLDKRRTKITRLNIPIDKFVMTRYL